MQKLIALFGLLLACCAHTATDAEGFRRDIHSIVMVDVVSNASGTAGWFGTGFSVSTHDGITEILTNKHICSAMDQVFYFIIGAEGNRIEARFIRNDESNDLCLLQAVTTIEPLRLAGSDEDRAEKIFVIGSPDGVFPVITSGYVSGHSVIDLGDKEITRLIIISAPITHGSSGSPVFNSKGLVVGIINAFRPDTPITYMVGVEEIRRFLSSK